MSGIHEARRAAKDLIDREGSGAVADVLNRFGVTKLTHLRLRDVDAFVEACYPSPAPARVEVDLWVTPEGYNGANVDATGRAYHVKGALTLPGGADRGTDVGEAVRRIEEALAQEDAAPITNLLLAAWSELTGEDPQDFPS